MIGKVFLQKGAIFIKQYYIIAYDKNENTILLCKNKKEYFWKSSNEVELNEIAWENKDKICELLQKLSTDLLKIYYKSSRNLPFNIKNFSNSLIFYNKELIDIKKMPVIKKIEIQF